MEEWKEVRLEECVSLLGDGLHGTPKYTENGEYAFINGNNLINGKIVIKPETKRVNEDEYLKYKKNLTDRTIFVSINGTIGNVGTYNGEKIILGKSACYFNVLDGIDKAFIKYIVSSPSFKTYLETNATGTTIKNVSLAQMRNYSFLLPPLPTQQKIAAIISSLDDKIELNNKINDNLEQQAQTVFKEIFADKIKNVSEIDGKPLGTLIDIVDNRGKTPPSSNEKNKFPILDVGALNSVGRIIDYKNCTKYVDEQTYSTFFRDGHPNENDILLSTVGSLAQMKFFKGDKGCIAQNVVAFRTLSISPFYLYEYLKFIKNDLLAYDIGSVQPSIKVTHIIKHLIYIPKNEDLSKFESCAKAITEQIYNHVCENERLIALRDSLLPKLMSGEIDVDSVQI